MTGARPLAAFVLVFCVAWVPLPALELEAGVGITVDVAPFGVEAVEPLAIAGSWFCRRDGIQAGAVVAGSLSADMPDVAAALCLRVWPARDRAALCAGAGVLLAPGQDPALMPYLVGGLRLETGHLALIAPGAAMRFKPTGSDTEVWLAVLWRL